MGDGPDENQGGGAGGALVCEAGELKLLCDLRGTVLYRGEFSIVGDRSLDLAILGVRGTILIPDLIRLSRWLGRPMGEGGDEKERDKSLEGVDVAGGAQGWSVGRGGNGGAARSETSAGAVTDESKACDEGPGGGGTDGGPESFTGGSGGCCGAGAESFAGGSGGCCGAAGAETLARSLASATEMLLSFLFSLTGRSGPCPGPF